MQEALRIGQLAKRAGVKPDTVRFYERCGLLPKAKRAANGYRTYDAVAARQLGFIKRAQALGFSLAEIDCILKLRGRGKTTCDRVLAMAETTLAHLEIRIVRDQRLADSLRGNLIRWRNGIPKKKELVAEFCVLIESSAAGNDELKGGETIWHSKKVKSIAAPMRNAAAKSK